MSLILKYIRHVSEIVLCAADLIVLLLKFHSMTEYIPVQVEQVQIIAQNRVPRYIDFKFHCTMERRYMLSIGVLAFAFKWMRTHADTVD